MNQWTILCVDDEPNVLKTLALVLRHHGHTVLVATNLNEALQAVASCPVDIALIDASICDGEQVCLRELLQERQPSIKVILHTGRPESVECAAEVPILPKPVDPARITARLAEILGE